MEKMSTAKKILQGFIPEPLLAMRRRWLTERIAQDIAKTADPKGAFSRIYAKGYWGKSGDEIDNFYSGAGSHNAEIVETYVGAMTEFLASFSPKPDVVDLGCGDFAVGSRIRPLCGKYIACDVVDALIERNRAKFHGAEVDFRVIDIIADELPAAEIGFLRQVLQHLSNADILRIVPKLAHKYKFVVLTEHLPLGADFEPNIDKVRGADVRINKGATGSGVVLTAPPFNLSAQKVMRLCEVRYDMGTYPGIVRTDVIVL